MSRDSSASGREPCARTPDSATAGFSFVRIPPTGNRGPEAMLRTQTDSLSGGNRRRCKRIRRCYHSLHYATAVVGLNTSAMIEAAIVGKSIYTIRTSEFAGGQEQTLHFHYLLAENGGPVQVADTLAQHVEQLAGGLLDSQTGACRSRQFVESFVRPRGIDRPVAPIVADEIERVATLRKRRRRAPLWHRPARRLLLAALRRRSGHAD